MNQARTLQQGSPKSTTDAGSEAAREASHTISLLVDDEAGVLARVIGLFSGRGYNIDSLTVAALPVLDAASERGDGASEPSEPGERSGLSRITIKTSGTAMVIEQIKAQLERLVPVHRVADLTATGPFVERDLMLVKVVASGDARVECLRLADAFRARVVDSTVSSFVFELTGSASKLDAFAHLMKDLGEVEIARTGAAALVRGTDIL